MSEAEQRYQAVSAVIGDGLSVSQAADKTGVAQATERFIDELLAPGARA